MKTFTTEMALLVICCSVLSNAGSIECPYEELDTGNVAIYKNVIYGKDRWHAPDIPRFHARTMAIHPAFAHCLLAAHIDERPTYGPN